MSAAVFEGLTVRYGQKIALDALTAELPEGCVGLLGPNGAGKTTLLKTLLGFLAPSEGTARVFDFDLRKETSAIRNLVGYMPEQDCHLPGMTGVEFVAYMAELSGMPTSEAIRGAHETLQYAGLGEARYRAVETYSTGMKQRVKLAQALVHGPRLLLLDEPTNGLDPKGREDMLAMVRRIAEELGSSVLLCSHLLMDVERTCDHVIMLNRGKALRSGRIEDLKKFEAEGLDIELSETPPELFRAIQALGLGTEATGKGRLRISGIGSAEEMAAQMLAAAAEAGVQVRSINPLRRTLEDIFMEAIHGA